MNRFSRWMRWASMVASGAIVFQAAGCDAFLPALQILQTVFLGVAAVASYMIIREI